MADHPDQSVAPSSDTSPSNDEKALQELRALLLSEEQKHIVELQERLDNPAKRSRETSEVVAEAIRLRREQGGGQDLRDALAPSVQEALRESVQKDSSILADVLFPVMGPAIRKSVAETMRSMLESFNKALESSLSIQGLKWRFEAFRTGRSYAEVALLRSIVYRVEQVFVIHKKTSLLLLHAVGAHVEAKDADMVSGMLSAIQDFVRDSFQAAQGEALDKLQVGDLQVWVEHGPHATIAAVVRGEAPQTYRLKLQEELEDFHQRFGALLESFEGDASPFESFKPDLDACLLAQYTKDAGKPRPYFIILMLILLGFLAGWQLWAHLQARKWEAFVDILRHEPGIVVTGMSKDDGKFHIRGLRDPLAINPSVLAKTAGLDTRQAEFEWQGYYSLDDAIVLRRARQFLLPPATAILGVERGTLRVAGEAPPQWAVQLRMKATLVAGVMALDDRNLNNPNAFMRSKAAVESGIILFDGGSYDLKADQAQPLAQLVDATRSLIQSATEAHSAIQVELVGHSDSTGTESTNTPLSEARARRVKQELEQAGIDGRFLIVRGTGTSEPVRREESSSDLQYNRSVTFQVKMVTDKK
jgi:outer membrane protein OmpA-like peptidoglycan-associated protein